MENFSQMAGMLVCVPNFQLGWNLLGKEGKYVKVVTRATFSRRDFYRFYGTCKLEETFLWLSTITDRVI